MRAVKKSVFVLALGLFLCAIMGLILDEKIASLSHRILEIEEKVQ